jgi:hypothetical protein
MMDKPFLLHGNLVKKTNVEGAMIENGYMEIREQLETIERNVPVEVVQEMEKENTIPSEKEEIEEKKNWFKRWFKK